MRGLGELQAALRDAQFAIEVGPTSLLGYVRKAEALQANGRPEQAVDALAAAVAAGADVSEEAGSHLQRDFQALRKALEESISATTVPLTLAATKLDRLDLDLDLDLGLGLGLTGGGGEVVQVSTVRLHIISHETKMNPFFRVSSSVKNTVSIHEKFKNISNIRPFLFKSSRFPS